MSSDEFKDLLDELKQELLQMTPEKRVRLIIDNYMKIKKPSKQLKYSFLEWLCDARYQNEKDAVMEDILHSFIDEV